LIGIHCYEEDLLFRFGYDFSAKPQRQKSLICTTTEDKLGNSTWLSKFRHNHNQNLEKSSWLSEWFY
jgi:hypothetical protein